MSFLAKRMQILPRRAPHLLTILLYSYFLHPDQGTKKATPKESPHSTLCGGLTLTRSLLAPTDVLSVPQNGVQYAPVA